MPTPISIRVSEETARRLDYLSRQTGRSKAFYLRKLIEENLDDMEDYYLAAERFAESRKKGVRRLSADEVSRELELDD